MARSTSRRAKRSARLELLRGLARRPKDRVQQQLLIARIAPYGRLVTERRIKDAALAIKPRPGERPAIKARPHRAKAQIDGCRIKPQQDMRVAIVEIADLI